ncbi:hypothetical protein ACF2JD_02120 [Aeromonas sp. A-5]|uniref:hypothetical protein n=1 Tax=Aeromonas ichthyocola TaxID=3367746 RepID=UPI0038F38199
MAFLIRFISALFLFISPIQELFRAHAQKKQETQFNCTSKKNTTKTKQNKTKQNKTKQNKTKQNKTKQKHNKKEKVVI